jgi:hypothetical protein
VGRTLLSLTLLGNFFAMSRPKQFVLKGFEKTQFSQQKADQYWETLRVGIETIYKQESSSLSFQDLFKWVSRPRAV